MNIRRPLLTAIAMLAVLALLILAATELDPFFDMWGF